MNSQYQTTSGRALAPDLSRGVMLLFIALANVPWYLYGEPTHVSNMHRLDPEGANLVWQHISMIAIDGRSYPLFAILFGYGLWQLYSRQEAAGRTSREARTIMQLRHLWMVVFGLLHVALLWQGDIVAAYGLAGLIVVWLFLRRGNTTLMVWIIVVMSVMALFAVLGIIGGLFISADGGFAVPAMAQLGEISNYAASISARLSFWVSFGIFQGILLIPLTFIGILAARRGILENPLEHRRLLAMTAVGGIALGWLGAVPFTLASTGAWEFFPPMLMGLHTVSGFVAAVGYAALFALIAASITQHGGPGPVTNAIAAVGKRSLTSYLAQSVFFAPLLCAWGLGLGGVLSQWQAALLAVGVWLVILAFAVVLERAGKRGPAEWLLRKLAYRRNFTSATPMR